MSDQTPLMENPYAGPRALRIGEQIYGRERETNQLANLIIAERIVLLHSPSGAGKTSLLQAAIIPRMRKNFAVLPIIRVNVDLSETVQVENRYVLSTLLSLEETLPKDQQLALEDLVSMRLSEYLARRPREVGAPRTEVLIFDQFEEILTLDPTDQDLKRAFFEQLGEALEQPNRWALFSMREDYLAALDPYRLLVPSRLENTFRLDLLGRQAAQQAIQGPPHERGVAFEEAAALKLVNDLRQMRVQQPDGSTRPQPGPYVEPLLLQVVCYRLWETPRQNPERITIDDLQRFGETDQSLVDQSLAAYYEEQVKAAAKKTDNSERSVREWFDQRLILRQGVRGVVRMEAERSSDLDNLTIQALVNAHLVRPENRGGGTWFELIHDRFITPIQANNDAWFTENLVLAQRQAVLWDQENRPEGLLLLGQDLEKAETWASERETELLPIEREFLEASRWRQSRLEGARRRRRRWLGTVVVMLAVIIAGVSLYYGSAAMRLAQVAFEAREQSATDAQIAFDALADAEAAEATAETARIEALKNLEAAQTASTQSAIERQNALDAQATAEAERDAAATAQAETNIQLGINRANSLADQALGNLEEDLERALLLSIEASNRAQTERTRSALLTALQRKLARRVVQNGPLVPLSDYGNITAVAYSRDGSRLALGAFSGHVLLWEPDAGGSPQPIGRMAGQVLSAAFHPNGRILATGDTNRTIVLWDLDTGESIAQITANNFILSLAFSPDGYSLASGGSGINRRIFVYDVQDPGNPSLRVQLNDPRDDVRSAVWSPDGTLLAAGGDEFDQDLWVWDVNSGQLLRQMTGHPSAIWRVAWSPDGRRLATGDAQGNIFLWDYDSGQMLGKLKKINFAEVIGLTFSLDSNTLISIQYSGVLGIWDVEERTLLLQTQVALGLQAAFTESRDQMAIGSPGSLTLWDLELDQPLRQPQDRLEGPVQSLIFRDAQTLLAGTNNSQQVRVWLLGPDPQPQELFVMPGIYESCAISPAADLLALGQEDGAIQLLDMITGDSVAQIDHFSDPISSMAFGYQGEYFAFGTVAGNSIIWDLQDNESALTFLSSLVRYPENEGGATALAFSPEGSSFVTGFENGGLNLWGLKGETLEGNIPWFAQRTGIRSLALSPDGLMLAAGGYDQTITLWNMATFEQIGEPLSGAESVVTSLAFHPSGLILLAGEADGVIAEWDLDPASWIRRACELAGRNLRIEEWETYFPDEPYRETCPEVP